MPSRPSLQAWAKTVGPAPSICSLNLMPGAALPTIDASAALRTSSGSRRRSSPFTLDQVEGVKEYAFVSALVTDEIERGNAVVITGNSLAVDNAGARPQTGQRLNDQREAASEVITRTAVEPHLCASLAGNDAEAVVLDLVQPIAAGRQLVGFGHRNGRQRRLNCHSRSMAGDRRCRENRLYLSHARA